MNKSRIKAKKSKPMDIKAGDLLYVRPSTNNMHQFIAKENSCFFDICLPNYSADSHTRKGTYYKETGESVQNNLRGGLTELEYLTNQTLGLPKGFSINEIDYRGSLAWTARH